MMFFVSCSIPWYACTVFSPFLCATLPVCFSVVSDGWPSSWFFLRGIWRRGGNLWNLTSYIPPWSNNHACLFTTFLIFFSVFHPFPGTICLCGVAKKSTPHPFPGGYTSPCSFSVGEEVMVLKNKLPASPGIVRAVFQVSERALKMQHLVCLIAIEPFQF